MTVAPMSSAVGTVDGVAPRPRDDELDMFGITHPGKVRPDNQDHFMLCTVHPQVVVWNTSLPDPDQLPLRGTRLATLLLVADGVGGASGGSEAARLATEAVTRYVSSTLRCYHAAGKSNDEEFLAALREAAMQAHDCVRAEAAVSPKAQHMATTLTLALVVWPFVYVVQVGDSRCYHYASGKVRQITRDQTIAQQLVDQGAMAPKDLKRSPLSHVLASAIGADEALPDVSRITTVGDRSGVLLLCTDGLTKHVNDDEIRQHIEAMTSSEQLCRGLLDLTLERGGSDNVTIVAARAPVKRTQ
ncbi:MAG TPA: protein phosphatase 2C domain-containing protein [Gemmatimonadaceae bacterium]|nr:protein phosphatase 2C domain-containing protein [Gemmatimonadaceae bacterium]